MLLALPATDSTSAAVRAYTMVLSLFYRTVRQERNQENRHPTETSYWLVQEDDPYGMIPIERMCVAVSISLASWSFDA
jgi:hypothetical protein